MNRSLSAVLATAAIDAMGIALTLPILPALLREVGHGGASGSSGWRYGSFLALYALMQFLLSPVLGGLSDRYGRRPVLLLSLVGQSAAYVVLALAPTFGWLLLGRALAGATGATGATGAVAAAFIADVTTATRRARRFGQLGACIGLGYIAGPALGGVLGAHGVRLPFVAAAVLALLNTLWSAFALRPSRTTGDDREGTHDEAVDGVRDTLGHATGSSSEPRPNVDVRAHLPLDAQNDPGNDAARAPGHAVGASLDPFGSLRWAWRTPGLPPALLAYAVFAFVAEIGGTVWVPYGEDRFAWSPLQLGASLACFGLCHALVQAFVAGPVVERWVERRALLLGALADTLAYLLIAVASHGWMAFALLPLFCVGGLASPALQALLSGGIDDRHQGRLQGLLASAAGLVSVLGPLSISVLYFASRATLPGLVWLLGAGLYALGVPLALVVLRSGTVPKSGPR